MPPPAAGAEYPVPSAWQDAVAARMRAYGEAKTVSETLKERQRRVNFEHEHEKISDAEWLAKSAEIEEQRSHLIVPPAPLFVQQRQVLTTLVDEWFVMTVDERKRMLTGIFDSIAASAEGSTGWNHARTGDPT